MKVTVNWSWVLGVCFGGISVGAVLIPMANMYMDNMYEQGKRDGMELMNELWKIVYKAEHHNVERKEEP